MKIKVIGKKHWKGTSKKTGNDYDFTAVFYIGSDDGVIGQCGLDISVDPAVCPFNSIDVNREYDVEFGPRGRVVAFAPAK